MCNLTGINFARKIKAHYEELPTQIKSLSTKFFRNFAFQILYILSWKESLHLSISEKQVMYFKLKDIDQSLGELKNLYISIIGLADLSEISFLLIGDESLPSVRAQTIIIRQFHGFGWRRKHNSKIASLSLSPNVR